MGKDYVVVVLTDNSGREMFDKVIYYQQGEIDRVQRHIDLLSIVGFKASAVEIPLEDFNATRACDVFLAYALAHGISYELAWMGRECIRRADEQNWCADRKKASGMEDNGRAMIGLAVREPDEARKLWTRLASTDEEKNFIWHRIHAADIKKSTIDHNNGIR